MTGSRILRFTKRGAEKMEAAGIHVEPGDVAVVLPPTPDPDTCGYRPCSGFLCCEHGAVNCPHRTFEDAS